MTDPDTALNLPVSRPPSPDGVGSSSWASSRVAWKKGMMPEIDSLSHYCIVSFAELRYVDAETRMRRQIAASELIVDNACQPIDISVTGAVFNVRLC